MLKLCGFHISNYHNKVRLARRIRVVLDQVNPALQGLAHSNNAYTLTAD